MTIEHFLQQNTRKLDAAGVGTGRLDILILLEDCLNTNRTHLLAHPELELTIEQFKWLNLRIVRRAKHEPLAFIRGKTEFYGREFNINKNVLEPRPESETMIDMLKSLFQKKQTDSTHQMPDFHPLGKYSNKLAIIDVGTGSGALAITAKLEFPSADVIGTDIDPKCIKVAQSNAAMHNIEIEFKKGDLILPLSSTLTLPEPKFVLANLPYVPDNFRINEAAGVEPRIAIFGGKDGLNLYRRMFEQIESIKNKPVVVLTESMPPQHNKLTKIARNSGYKLARTDDFIQQFVTTDLISN